MNDIYESYSIDAEIIDDMDSNELENLMTGLTYLNQQIQNQNKVVIDPGGIFRQIFNIITGKRKKAKKQIELDKSEAINLISKIYEALEKRYTLVAKKEIEIEEKRSALLKVAVPILEFADKYSIPLSQEIKSSLLLLTDTRVEHSNSEYLIASKITSSNYMLESRGYSNISHEEKKESDNLVEDPTLKKKIEALRRDGYSTEEIEEQFGKVYTGLKTTDSYTTRRLKFNPPECKTGKQIGNKSRYEKELNLFKSRKRKIEKILNCKENYIIDKDLLYFIDKFSRRVKAESTESRFNTPYGFEGYGATRAVYKDEIYYCLCRIRLDASEPEETVFEDVNERSFININDGMIYFLDSKYNQRNIYVPY